MAFLACTNVQGPERLSLLVVGRGQRPRCFGSVSSGALGFKYQSGRKGWVNFNIFEDWLRRFEASIGRTRGRRALLLLDNASCHGSEDDLTFLRNVRVKFLQNRTTSIVQPLELKVIAAIKKKYQHKLAQRAVDLVDCGVFEDLYRLQRSVIHNCWLKSRLV